MPHFESSLVVARTLTDVFEFFRQPANLVRVSPPELHMKLVEGPERIELGSRVIIQARRWGVVQRVVSEITSFESDVAFIDEQREGPLKRWKHTHRFETAGTGTRVIDAIDFEPPGGMLGLVVTAAFVERDLKWIFEHRTRVLGELLGAVA
ncbi:MAG: SRPBCC family protein [Gemmataceae bacterium]|nr:SRPBCC family protein [Gemmataceae bacterium]